MKEQKQGGKVRVAGGQSSRGVRCEMRVEDGDASSSQTTEVRADGFLQKPPLEHGGCWARMQKRDVAERLAGGLL